jgi:hypothetical protein
MVTATVQRSALLLASAALSLVGWGCGKKAGSSGGGGAKVGQVEAAFNAAAHATGVPVRFLMASAYLESRLSPENATAHYVSTNGEGAPISRGTSLTQTAFGLTYETLGLDATKAASATLEIQIEAYAKYVAAQTQGLNLAASPHTDEDKYYWVANLADLHRSGFKRDGQSERRNIQVVFAHELLQILNEGFVWQDPNNGEKLELTKESPKLDIAHFPADGQKWFGLTEDAGQIFTAAYVPLVTVPSGDLENHPKRVEVIHCPLSLSACLELQNGMGDQDDEVHLAAHYVIPNEDSLTDTDDGAPQAPIFSKKVLQVANQKEVVILTDKLGVHQPVDDAVVVMLTGNSGRLVNGTRDPALPNWFNDQQLRSMGQVINDVCTLLAQNDPANVSRDQCMATSGDNGVQFRHQDSAEEYRWGDIPDFDPTIFQAYLASPGGLGTEVAFQFAGGKKRFNKGEAIPLTILFNSTVKTVELERLVRCQNGQTAWAVVSNQDIRGDKKLAIVEHRFDAGPNRNGEQFYRAKVYGMDGTLIGWSIDRVVLATFDKDPVLVPNSTCAANGT